MAGIYIHIPFCKQRCNYCSFYSTTLYNIKEQYADAVCKELEVRKEYAGYEEIKTIYFGGGTPSTLPIALLQKICNAIYANHLVSNEAEVTIECNPDDLNKDYIKGLRSLPINRLSMGIQTFSEEELNAFYSTMDKLSRNIRQEK